VERKIMLTKTRMTGVQGMYLVAVALPKWGLICQWRSRVAVFRAIAPQTGRVLGSSSREITASKRRIYSQPNPLSNGQIGRGKENSQTRSRVTTLFLYREFFSVLRRSRQRDGKAASIRPG
jgi:hypothetical protein